MRIAIAGTNGLAQYIANYIDNTTSHQFVVLSRSPAPALVARGWQVIQVDYAKSNSTDLRFNLTGVDIVISTISGHAQMVLIEAAAATHVRRFVPSEFGGPPALRPRNDLSDNQRRAALGRLHQLEASGMRFTIFTCGILYERFAPGGLAASQIATGSVTAQEGSYLMDFRHRKAQIPVHGPSGNIPRICMTSARDVARDVVAIAEQVQGSPFEISNHTRASLQDSLTYARATGDRAREEHVHDLLATSEGRFDFTTTTLNQLVSVQPEGFRDWLLRAWSSAT
ncbi:hypothetical protein B0A52_04720 [Exophiala mesophila]|uniref:NAD(P)-binding domain-containing protein n=1 Tax=Exophiala mesophila TaxID=212818 RepID=A0A438N920_EXOME|nr:hypothetical protein B0A52_04720 [Exophiala mesophila]